jgi:hypothetical protein
MRVIALSFRTVEVVRMAVLAPFAVMALAGIVGQVNSVPTVAESTVSSKRM